MPKFPILNEQGKETESIDLPDNIFGNPVNKDVIHQAVVMYQACLRQGTADTKERNEISGGGKKPFRQKGTGQARQGSIRSPLWHGGGVVHGPQPRDYSYSIPKKIKRLALRESLNAKYQGKTLVCLTDLKNTYNKTKEFAQILKTLNLRGKTLALLDGSNDSVEKASRNIRLFELKRSQDVNAYDIMRYKNVLTTKTALKKLLDRIKK